MVNCITILAKSNGKYDHIEQLAEFNKKKIIWNDIQFNYELICLIKIITF